ncbi:MarR family winged helix-turn-helix transcriptional regulator [Streptomyces sp. 3330]|uniref:MarR family winged helix-turn-helix transcriptional regulator n=1 Tax=Streptomyces sp. 3330 TaxID=2817755 RepID=UPI00286AEB40|nr:MarR family winged helix-turn-helix transcriptional regulator [Streptomyces sp. 3330]
MTSQVLRALENKGLIEREVDPAGTRAKRLRVTDTGGDLAPPCDGRGGAGRRAVLPARAARRRRSFARSPGPSSSPALKLSPIPNTTPGRAWRARGLSAAVAVVSHAMGTPCAVPERYMCEFQRRR